MAQRPASRIMMIFVVAVLVVALLGTMVLLSLAALGVQIATDITPFLTVVTILIAWYTVYLQRSSESESSEERPSPVKGTPDNKLFSKLWRPTANHQTVALAGITLGILVCLLCVSDAPPIGGNTATISDDTLTVSGGVTLLQQDSYLKSQRALVFQLSNGQYGYLARPDDRWWLPWPSKYLAPIWPGFMDATVFASLYSGLEFLGLEGNVVVFTHRDNVLRWYDPGPILVNGLQLTGVSTRPGFMQYAWSGTNQQFLALVPRANGGLGLYERIEKFPWGWIGPVGSGIGTKLGTISAVTSVELGDGSLYVVVCAGSHLFELTHPLLTYSSNGPPNDFGKGWSAPKEIRDGNGSPISVAGYPQLITTGVSALGTSSLLLAAPVHNGAMLLSNTDGGDVWNIERLPINHSVDALTLLSGTVDGRPNIDVTYREGDRLLYIWRWDNGPWYGPAPVKWGNGSSP